MQLYFIAIVPPPTLSDEINSIKQLFSIYHQSSRALKSPPHITLRPPFKMFREKEVELQTSLTEFTKKQSRFSIRLNGYGHFRSDVIYIKPDPCPRLNNLYTSLQAWLLTNNNLPALPSYPVFTPHITVAYRDLSKQAFTSAWQTFQQKAFIASFEVNNIYLLKHVKQKWEIVHEFSFLNPEIAI